MALLRPASRATTSARSAAAMSSISCQAPFAVGHDGGDPQRGGQHVTGRGAGIRLLHILDGRPQTLGQHHGALAVGAPQHHAEFARSAVSRDDVARAVNQRLQRVRDALEARVALGFALALVERRGNDRPRS